MVKTAAATLSQYNYDEISWPAVTGANTYDVLRTTSVTAPTGACACAVATAVSGLTTNDQSNSLSAYTVNTYAGDTTFNITNVAVGAGESKLTFAADHGAQFIVDNINGASFGSLSSSHPSITPNSIETVLYADQFAGAHASADTTTGAISASSKSLVLSNAEDFRNGDGIIVIGAGSANTLATPATPTITATGTPSGSQTCLYSVAALDGGMGLSAASTATTAQNCGNIGDSTDNLISVYNLLSWAPVADATGYVVYENIASAGWKPAAVVQIPTSVQWWTASAVVPVGQLIQPRGAQFNGWFYSATVAGTTGSTQPTWCTTVGCTVTDGGATWTAQSFTFHDDGRNWAWFGSIPSPESWLPPTPPSTPTGDALVTTVASGGGTTSITLADAASSTVASAYVGHDNTAALNAAFAAQSADCSSFQPAPGSGFAGQCPTVAIPAGSWYVSGSISAPAAYGTIRADRASVVVQLNPVSDVFSLSNAYQNTVRGLDVLGGKRQLFFGNGQQDSIKVDVYNSRFEFSNDYAVAAFNNQTPSDIHLSSNLGIHSSQFLADQGELWEYGDRAEWDSNWSETFPSQQSLMWGAGQIVMAEGPGGELHSHDSEFIPGFSTPGGAKSGAPAGEHWIEDWWNYSSDSDRFSADSGTGYPCVYYDGGFPFNDVGVGIFSGGSVSLTNDWLFCGGFQSGAKVYMASGIPMSTIVKNNIGYTERIAATAPANNIDVGLLPYLKSAVNPSPTYSSLGTINIQIAPNNGMVSCTLPWESLVLQFPSAGFLFPASLVPFISEPECRLLAANPTDGYWGVNERGFFQQTSGTVGQRGFVNIRQGLAAPTWQSGHSYTVGTFAVPTSDNAHVYEVTTAGTSGGSEPAWCTGSGCTVTDGTVTWTEEGQAALFAPLGPIMDASGNATFTGNVGVGGTLNATTLEQGSQAVTLAGANGLSAGTITISSSTTGSHPFAVHYSTPPTCNVTEAGSTPAALNPAVASSTSAVTVTVAVSGTYTFNFQCVPAVN